MAIKIPSGASQKIRNRASAQQIGVLAWMAAAFSTLLLFLLCLAAAWLIMRPANFFYGTWHDLGGISEGIATFAPQNQFKPGFADTSRAQRVEIFAAIVAAVHNGGQGLEKIQYQSASSQGPQLLLRESEIVHLQDVARLIGFLKIVCVGILLLYLLLVFLQWRYRRASLHVSRQLISLSGFLLLAALILSIAGPKSIFHQLHIWVFPENHQWFFYYQESLMSTMMLAPTLFAWIAASLCLLALLIFTLTLLCWRWVLWYFPNRRM